MVSWLWRLLVVAVVVGLVGRARGCGVGECRGRGGLWWRGWRLRRGVVGVLIEGGCALLEVWSLLTRRTWLGLVLI